MILFYKPTTTTTSASLSASTGAGASASWERKCLEKEMCFKENECNKKIAYNWMEGVEINKVYLH